MHRIISVTLIVGIIAPILIGFLPVTVQAQLNDPAETTPTGQLANTAECSVATTNGATDVNSLASVKNNLAEKAAKLTQLSRDLTSLDQQLVILQELNKNIVQGESSGATGWVYNTSEYNGWVEQRRNISQKILLQIKNISDGFPEKSNDLGYVYNSTYYPQNTNPVTILSNDLTNQNEVKNLIDRGERVILTTKDDVATINKNIDSINICNTQTTTPDDQEAITQQQEDAAARASAEEAANNTRAESIADTNSNSTPALPLSECVMWKAGTWLSCFRDAVSALMQIMTWLFSFVVYLAAKVFNAAISYSILDFKDMTDSLFISTLWATVRDIANMMIIFFLLYIALATILQLQSVDTAKAFTAIIIVSLLVNFSGVITRVAIDVSNVSALVFYNRFVGTDGQADLSGYFIMNSDLGKLITVDPTRPGGNNDVSSQIFAILVKGFSNAILSCITAFVLIMAAGFFIVRTATLIFLIILSPLAFIGYAIPFVKTKVSDVWYKELIGQITFAPVFMGLFYFTIKLTEGVNSLDVRAVDSAAGQVIIYAMLMAMMLGCLKIARNSATGMASSQIKSWGSAGAGFLGGAIATNTLGRGASSLAKSKTFNSAAARIPGGGLAITGLNKMSNYGFGSKQGYIARTSASEKVLSEQMQNMNTEQKVKFISRFNTKTQQINAYNALSDKDKIALELEVQKNPQKYSSEERMFGTAWARSGIRIESMKGQLRGEKQENLNKAIETEKVKDIRKQAAEEKTEAERYKKLASLVAQISSDDERKTVFGGLTDKERAAIVSHSSVEDKTTLESLASKLTGEKYEKYQEETRKMTQGTARVEVKNHLKEIANGNRTRIDTEAGMPILDDLEDSVKKLNPNDVITLEEDLLINPNINRFFSKQHLTAIWKDKFISQETRDKIYENIVTNNNGYPESIQWCQNNIGIQTQRRLHRERLSNEERAERARRVPDNAYVPPRARGLGNPFNADEDEENNTQNQN
ncbi:MAG: hypothetical protein K8Q91_03560 [Candidatus Vogelbacteria bacterium]|nr:hypothetical protein [Candidatus Vogelbacteria bacterium]